MKKTKPGQNEANHIEDCLKQLEAQLSGLEKQIQNLSNAMDILEQGKQEVPRASPRAVPAAALPGRGANIIPFRLPGSSPESKEEAQRRFEKLLASVPFLAHPGVKLPPQIPDFRGVLQRDGLILLAWDKRNTEEGDRYTAYWVSSSGVPRYYASKPAPFSTFSEAQPDHKSYAAEDGIEYYGQDSPRYMVHVAPQLMMNHPGHQDLRASHIEVLKKQGCHSNFNAKFLLSEGRRKKPSQGRGKAV
ncbi:MAG: hypothetical protein FWH12_02130 [Treponema sp.]|nr:hypothetical protein [Treponema sp.]